MAKQTWIDFGTEVAKSLGLDPGNVSRLTIDVQTGGMVTATAEMFVEGSATADAIKRFKFCTHEEGVTDGEVRE